MPPRLHRQKLQSKGKTFRLKKQAMASSIEVSHIEVEQELVALPPVKSGTTAGAVDAHPLQLLLVPPSSRLGTGGATTKQMETSLCDPPKAKFGNAAVSVGVAVQVSASSYVPCLKGASQGGQRGQLKTATAASVPPPVPPRSGLRLSVNSAAAADLYASGGHPPPTSPFHFRPGMPRDMQSHVIRTHRQPPLLEESDYAEKSGDNQQAEHAELSPEFSVGQLRPVSSTVATSSNESLAFVEETLRLLTASICPENDENTLI